MSACPCPTWKENIGYVAGPILENALRRGIAYKGAEFTHCPWCGSSLSATNGSPVEREARNRNNDSRLS